MKKTLKSGAIILVFAACVLPVFITGCYTDTIDSFSKFTVQLPLHFTAKWRNKFAPDVSTDFTDLNTYKEYRDNKEKIQSTIFYQFAYWIDSLRTEPGDPTIDQVEFEFVKYYLYFEGEPESAKRLIGQFNNVKVKDYFRIPHVLEVPDAVAQDIAKVAKTNPRFFTIAEYSAPAGQPAGTKRSFPHIDSRFDVVVRLELKL